MEKIPTWLYKTVITGQCIRCMYGVEPSTLRSI